MIGRIRTEEKCPRCHGAFAFDERLGYVCGTCLTTPKRFFILFQWKGKRFRIFSDKQGQAIDSYRRAITVQSNIQAEMEPPEGRPSTFNPSQYKRAEIQRFWARNILQEFLDKKKPGIAPSYLPNYEIMTETAKNFFADLDVREIQKVHLVRYKDELETKKFAAKTVKNYMDFFRAFLRWCRSELGILEVVPTFPVVKFQPPPFAWVEREDQIKLFEAVPDAHKPFIRFLMLHGCRPGEGRALRVKDIDLPRREIKIHATFSGKIYMERRKGKGARDLVIPIHPECLQDITERIPGKMPNAYLFSNPRTGNPYSKAKMQRIWDVVRMKTGIDKTLSLYDATRHSVASQLVNRGEPLITVSRLLGHSSIKMTEKYSHADIEKVRTSMDKLSLNKVVHVSALGGGLPAEDKRQKIIIKRQ